MNLLPIALTTETINDPNRAYQNESTVKPSIKEAANQNKEAFITSINRPNVSTVIGKVRINKIGLTNKLRSPIVIAAIIAG